MNAARLCKDRFEDIVALVMGELDAAGSAELEAHMTACGKCREVRDTLMEEEVMVRAGFEAIAGSLRPVDRVVLEQRRKESRVYRQISPNNLLERTKDMVFAHKRLSLAAAALTAAAAGLILYVSLFSSTAAYALEQTADANRHVTSFHVKITPAAELGEAWVELKVDGAPLQARLDLLSRDDGPKVVILLDQKAEVWLKKKDSLLVVKEKRGLEELAKMRVLYDPKLAFEQLQEAQRAGKVQVATKEPAKPGEPITLTVTSKEAPERREVYLVDPKTKLVQQVTDYRRRNGKWEQVSQREYLDYNKPIPAKIFHPELPKGILEIDEIHEKIGLEKGNLSDDQIATKVVGKFFAALIAKDYKTAGMIYAGMPAEKMKEAFGRFTFLRIVEMEKPRPAADSRMKALQVPIKVEWEVGGKKTVRSFAPYVRAVEGQPDRWAVAGGI